MRFLEVLSAGEFPKGRILLSERRDVGMMSEISQLITAATNALRFLYEIYKDIKKKK